MNVVLVGIDKKNHEISIFKNYKENNALNLNFEKENLIRVKNEIENIEISDNEDFNEIKTLIRDNIVEYCQRILEEDSNSSTVPLTVNMGFSNFPDFYKFKDKELLKNVFMLAISYFHFVLLIDKIDLFKNSIKNLSLFKTFSLEDENEIISYVDEKLVLENVKNADIEYREIDNIIEDDEDNDFVDGTGILN